MHSTTVLFITHFHVDQVKTEVSCNLSNHLPIFFLIVRHNLCRKVIKLYPVIFQSIEINSLDAFRCDIAAINWDTVLMQRTTDDAYNRFLEDVLKLCTYHFPYKSIKQPKKGMKAIDNLCHV